MATDGNFKWWWAIGISEPESYNGPCDTRDEAIAEAKGDLGSECGFIIVEADKAIPRTDVIDADYVFERYDENNEECWGEDGADIQCTREQENDLENMLAAAFEEWFKKHGIKRTGWAFGVMRNQETFEPSSATAES